MIYDEKQERMDIRFDNGEYQGGLHCGTMLDVYWEGQ